MRFLWDGKNNGEIYMFGRTFGGDKYAIRIESDGRGGRGGGFWDFVSGSAWMKDYDRIVKDGYVYYAVPHGKEYKVRMENNTGERVNATLSIDGERMGKWRVEPYESIVVNRPTYTERKFVFVKETSWEGRMGNVEEGDFRNGLVEVTFVPEMMIKCDDSMYFCTNSATPQRGYQRIERGLSGFGDGMRDGLSSGATVLGENSDQTFGRANHIVEDVSRSVVKRVRLVVKDVGVRKPYVSIRRDRDDDLVPPRVNEFLNEPYPVAR